MMDFICNCGRTFESKRGLNQHITKSSISICKNDIETELCDKLEQSPENIHQDFLELKNFVTNQINEQSSHIPSQPQEFTDFRNHINTVVNALGETFYSEINNLQSIIAVLKDEIEGKFQNYNENLTEIDQILTIHKNELDTAKIDIEATKNELNTINNELNAATKNTQSSQTLQTSPPANFHDQTPIIINTQTPAFQPAIHPSVAFQFPKRTARPEISEKNPVRLTNRFNSLQNIQKSWSPEPPVSTQFTSSAPARASPKKTKSTAPFINPHPEREKSLRLPKVVPGEFSYSEAASHPQRRKIALVGDSNYHGIKEHEMAILIKNSEVKNWAYSGATAKDLNHYVDIALKQQPESLILHGATNDILGRNKNAKSAEEIVIDLVNTGIKCRERGVRHVFISSVIVIDDVEAYKKAQDINFILKRYCEHYNFRYICNDFLTKRDLKYKDPVHLSWDGRRKLVDNYIFELNKY